MRFFKNQKLFLSRILQFAQQLDNIPAVNLKLDELSRDLLVIHQKIHPQLGALQDSGPDDTLHFLVEEIKMCLNDSDIESMQYVDFGYLEKLMEKLCGEGKLSFYQTGQVLHAIHQVCAEKKREQFLECCHDLLDYMETESFSEDLKHPIRQMIGILEVEDAWMAIQKCNDFLQKDKKLLEGIFRDDKTSPHLKPLVGFFGQLAIESQLKDEDQNSSSVRLNERVLDHYLIRLHAFAEGAKLVCRHSQKEDRIAQVENLEQKYIDFIQYKNSKTQKFNFQNSQRTLYFFKKELASLLEVTPKDIQNGESYWAWQSSHSRIKKFKPPAFNITNGNHVVKVEVGEHFVDLALTDDQKQELLSIFENPPPLWFLKRRIWEQDALKKDLRDNLNLPKDMDDVAPYLDHPGWENFAKRSMPATLKWLPIVGASQHELSINGQSYSAYRVSVPVPYDAHRKTQQHLTNLNMNQINEGIPKIHQQSSDKNMVLVSLITGRKTEGWISYLFLGFYDYVLGHYKPMKEYNVRMVKMEDKSIHHEMKITHYNFGVNWFRSAKPAPIPEDYIETLDAHNPFKSAIETHNKRITQIPIFDWENRNPNLFAAALIDASERYSGGVSIGHCKSSKDRKGIELLIADAILVHHQVYGQVPQFDDTGLNRSHFIHIVKKLFATGIYSDVAAFHSPGSCGLKDEAILPDDIKQALGEWYKVSKKMASWNKPKMGCLYTISATLTEPKAQYAIFAVELGLTVAGVLLSGSIASLCLVAVALILTQVVALLHQYSAHSLERELGNFKASNSQPK